MDGWMVEKDAEACRGGQELGGKKPFAIHCREGISRTSLDMSCRKTALPEMVGVNLVDRLVGIF